MFCPFKFNNPSIDLRYCQCEKEQCELWNERFGKCSLAVDAYLKGQEDIRAERGVKD